MNFQKITASTGNIIRWIRTSILVNIIDELKYLKQLYLNRPPSFRLAFAPLLVLSCVLFMRHPATNAIFDEQEALIANPYVNRTPCEGPPFSEAQAKNPDREKRPCMRFRDAIHRDFWGLAPDRSIGSYRPIPNFIWRAVWQFSEQRWIRIVSTKLHIYERIQNVSRHPYTHHLFNLLFHAVNGAVLTCFLFAATKRKRLAYFAGGIFVGCAVLTEAVSGVVGLADILGGLGALLALWALVLPAWGMPFAIFFSLLLGLFSKESAIVCIVLIPLASLATAPFLHPQKPLRALRFLLALIASLAAFALYVKLRKIWFPSPLSEELIQNLPANASKLQKIVRSFFVWFHQAPLPKDPLNNPLVNADTPHRIAGALRIYFRGLLQIIFPRMMSGDYSFPQEPIPEKIFSFETIAGGLCMGFPLILGFFLWVRGIFLEFQKKNRQIKEETLAQQSLIALGLFWVVVSYFPHSNIPVILPTVRAERFLYFPAIGSSILIAIFFDKLLRWRLNPFLEGARLGILLLFFGFQWNRAYCHAMDYRDDLIFWDAARKAVPNSSKAHLNYSVMMGARGDLQARLDANLVALKLAPKWPMAHIYVGDTLCRMKRVDEAWPYYKAGFELVQSDTGLISLSLQCLFDEGEMKSLEGELRTLAEKYPSSWLAYLIIDTLDNGDKNKGVDPKYRPRNYNQGPKEEE